MGLLVRMAWRDLGRNRRRSLFSSLGLGLGLSLLLLMAAVAEGEMRGAMESSIRLESGHLQVRAPSYDPDKASLGWKDLIEHPDAVAAQIAALPEVEVATPRLYASGIAVSGRRSVGVRIVGIEPTSPANQPFRDGLLGGAFLGPDDREGILMGQPLAERLGLGVGERLQVLVNTSDGTVDEQVFTIRGVFSTRTPAFDRFTLLMPLAKAQAITRAGDHASAVFILLHRREQAGTLAAALGALPYRVLTWEEMNVLLVQSEQMADAYMVLLYLVVLAITATVVVNTLIMAVFERTREIGVLAAIGMRRGRILALFLAESGLLALGGIGIGLVLGGLLVAYAARVGFYIGQMGVTGIMIGERIYAYLTVQDTVTLSLLALVVTLVASLYPAALAARLEPVAALHSEQ